MESSGSDGRVIVERWGGVVVVVVVVTTMVGG